MSIGVINGNFSYGKKPILKDINFNLEKGEILSILGPNGIGKTSLIKCITGLLEWTSGSSQVDKTDIRKMTKKELWKKISYVPQSIHFAFSYTGLEMVLLGITVNLSFFSQPGKKDLKKCLNIMEKLGIAYLAQRDCNTMSGGELQMVLIARALVSDPEIIILDEPESGLDFKNQLKILKLIEKLSHVEGLIAIINTHYPENAIAMSDKCLLLTRNYQYRYGLTKEILTEENIKEAFEVEVIIDKVSRKGIEYENIIPIAICN